MIGKVGMIRAAGIGSCLMLTIAGTTLVSCEGPAAVGERNEQVATESEAFTCGNACTTPSYNAATSSASCSAPLPCQPTCSQVRCGGVLWPATGIPYKIITSENGLTFSGGDLSNISNWIGVWNARTLGGAPPLFRCDIPTDTCSSYGRWLAIHPGGNGGISNIARTGQQDMTLAPGNAAYYDSHELGHAIGLPHLWNRPDRDRYLKFSNFWCGSQDLTDTVWTKCMAPGPGELGYDPKFPSIPTGLLGVFNETSVMNYISPDICESVNDCQPSAADTATDADGAAAIELYRSAEDWAPFNTLGDDVGQCSVLNYDLAPGVSMLGSPAVVSLGYPSLEVYVRGSDGHIYRRYKNVSGGVFQGWSSWSDLGGGFNSDPAAVSWGAGRIDVFARKSSDGAIYQRTYSGSWSSWTSIGKPSVGIGSAPAVSSWGPNRLDVFVKGSGDSLLYHKSFTGSWSSWAVRGDKTFVGKPAAVSWGNGRINVVVKRSNNVLWSIWYDGSWRSFYSLGSLADSGASPAVSSWGPNRLNVFYRYNGTLYLKTLMGNWLSPLPLGGQLVASGTPAAVAQTTPSNRIDVMAPVNDHGSLGVWWKYYPFQRPCYWASTSSCGGCNSAETNACQKAADLYGIVANVTFGFAPPEVQTWWTQNSCSASTASTTAQLCRNASNLYAIVAGSTFGGAPANVQTWWTQKGCNVTPDCQAVSDLFGTISNFSWGYAPSYVQSWWTGASCSTTPKLPTDTCQRAANTFAITANATFGFAPDYVQTWWTGQSCQAKAHF